MWNRIIIVISLVGVLAVGGAALLIYKGGGGDSDNVTTIAGTDQGGMVAEPVDGQASPELLDDYQAAGDYTGPKSDSEGNYRPPAGEGGTVTGLTPAPEDTSGLPPLGSFVTAQQSVSGDSIEILFYIQGKGNFSVQEKISGSWVTVKEGVYYIGSGGLPAGEMAPGEEPKTLRALRVESGQYTGVTGEFTVSREDVVSSGGIKTYPGGDGG